MDRWWGGVATGVGATVLLVTFLGIAYDMGKVHAHKDVRRQCETQESVRMTDSNGEVFFYCGRVKR